MNELGSRLKQAREEKGLSLDDLQTLTKIQKRYLQGIEEGNYSMMPGKFYVRAFIKQYAEAVGIDHEELFESYKADIPPVYDEQINENISRVQTKKTLPAGSSKVLDLLPKILLGVLVVGVVAVIYLFAQKNAGDDEKKEAAKGSQEVKIEESEDLKKTEETSATSDKKNAEDKKAEDKSKDDSKADEQKNDEKKQEEKATQALAVVSAQGNETAYELKNADKFELTVTTTGETWINILNGKGTSFFQGMLKKGATESQTVDFSKETEAVVVVGRSSDTEIFVNGQKLEYAVPVTEEVRQDITIRYVPPTQ
ncbi:helix-turn-helix domain-containing protein [Bacillus sp. DNRA2]|uniref:RodZ domain-containing protein n=1 Tax=Bacillus sp. DNRA2 TaxID=2723053 RepID=UPI00145CC217|nr:helix-turn-helix domain-containing protein [Bacillus sp. DNRA2]